MTLEVIKMSTQQLGTVSRPATKEGSSTHVKTLRIQRSTGWSSLNLRDLWEYRDLLVILAMRDVRLRYKQTALGIIWVILQPLLTALIFATIFGRLANLPSDGAPYLLFAFAGMLPWSLFSQAIQRAGSSLVLDSRLISKVYFPRMILPVASVLAVLVDTAVASIIMLALLVYYRMAFGWSLLAVPMLLGLTLLAAIGVSLWLSALNVQYRDFMYALPFIIQIWMFASPVAYSTNLIPEQWNMLYAMNPMVGLIEGFRWAFLGQGAFSFVTIAPTVATSLLFFLTGAYIFRRVERNFADVI